MLIIPEKKLEAIKRSPKKEILLRLKKYGSLLEQLDVYSNESQRSRFRIIAKLYKISIAIYNFVSS